MEPPGRSPLFELPALTGRVVAVPHLGASTHEAQHAVARQIAEQVLDALRGHNYVNAPALAAERGIAITQMRGMKLVDYPNLLSCRVSWGGGQRLAAGTLLAGARCV